jgi:hypothetical protein
MSWDADMWSRVVLYSLLALLAYCGALIFKVCLGVGLNHFARVRSDEIMEEIGRSRDIGDLHTFDIKNDKPMTNAKIDSVGRWQLLRRIY